VNPAVSQLQCPLQTVELLGPAPKPDRWLVNWDLSAKWPSQRSVHPQIIYSDRLVEPARGWPMTTSSQTVRTTLTKTSSNTCALVYITERQGPSFKVRVTAYRWIQTYRLRPRSSNRSKGGHLYYAVAIVAQELSFIRHSTNYAFVLRLLP
jgi:hypothetical protein